MADIWTNDEFPVAFDEAMPDPAHVKLCLIHCRSSDRSLFDAYHAGWDGAYILTTNDTNADGEAEAHQGFSHDILLPLTKRNEGCHDSG
jgi:hypothetical protein